MIAGRYELDREIGRGGMGAVWLGRDTVLGREVALKRIGMMPGATAPDLQRAEREARLAARLNHPHVVAVFDLVTEGAETWLVMEYVEGVSLSGLIARDGALTPDEAAPLVRQAADALAAAHAAGIVHRDVKPSNMMVTPQGDVKLTDFGIARAEADASLTQTGLVTGSPAYLAPEVASGATAHEASDVWSLGATLFYLVTGKPPFDGSDRTSPPPHTDDARLDAIIARCLADEPEERWPSAAELGEALERYLDAPRTSSRPVLLAVVGLSIVSIAVLGWLVAHARPTTEAIKPSPSIPTSTSSPLASTSMPSAVTTIIASAAPSSSASATSARSHCTCLADGWRLCKPELEETLCECHDTDGSLLFAKSDEVNDAAKARRKVPATSPSALVGTPCSGFASVIPKGETTARAKAGTGTYRPCSRDCSAWASFSGHEHDACNGLDEYGRPRSGALHCN